MVKKKRGGGGGRGMGAGGGVGECPIFYKKKKLKKMSVKQHLATFIKLEQHTHVYGSFS